MSISEALKGKVTKACNWKVYSPQGEEFIVYNLAEFCRIHNLNKKGMSKVVTNQRSHYKGWKVTKESGYEKPPSLKPRSPLPGL